MSLKNKKYSLCFLGILAMVFFTAVHSQTGPSIIEASGIKGGLVVHINFTNTSITSGLRISNKFIVHGIHTDAQVVSQARQTIKDLGVNGDVSISQFSGNVLPYADNMVNLVVSDNLGAVSMDEVNRVLSPLGVSYIKSGGAWTKTVKPYPPEMDEWTHHLRAPDNNAVSKDILIGPPRNIRFIAEPRYSRDHEHQASLSASVTGGGRIFSIVDKASPFNIRFAAKWHITARDAFNGKLLWEKPLSSWVSPTRWFRTGPTDLHYRMVVQGDYLYTTLGLNEPVMKLDAASGNILSTFEGTDKCSQIIITGNTLVTLIDPWVENAIDPETKYHITGDQTGIIRTIKVFNAGTNVQLWSKDINNAVFQTMAVKGEKLFYQTPNKVYCVNLLNGSQQWEAAHTMDLSHKKEEKESGWESPVMVAGDKGLYVADLKMVAGYSLTDGTFLWSPPTREVRQNVNAPSDLMIIGNNLWTKTSSQTAIDLTTGAVTMTYKTTKGYMHDRCYRGNATVNYLIIPRMGPQFLNINDGNVQEHYWTRGTCNFGHLTGNGLLYSPPHSCACNMQVKMNGFLAFSNKMNNRPEPINNITFVKGEAFNSLNDSLEQYVWPTYRANNRRGAVVSDSMGTKLAFVWKSPIGGTLSALTADHTHIYVASINKHTLYALSQNNGQIRWSFITGGRIDSPPTVYKGMLIFGCADGWIYSIRSKDGVLAWKRRLAPDDIHIMVHDQLESKWPVHGSALVLNDQIIATAGRQTYIDGGIYMYKLNPVTGDIIAETKMFDFGGSFGQPDRERNMPGGKNDVLSAEGSDVFMRHVKLDFTNGSTTGQGTHLFSEEGFLPREWWSRTYWSYSDHYLSHWREWYKIGNENPSGRIMSVSDDNIYGYGRSKYPGGNSGQWSGEFYRLYAFNRVDNTYPWSKKIPLYVRGMSVAGNDIMFIAGSPNIESPSQTSKYILDNNDAAVNSFLGNAGSKLIAVSTVTGDFIKEVDVESAPVFDGLITGPEHVYMAMEDGSVVCYHDNGGRVVDIDGSVNQPDIVDFVFSVKGRVMYISRAVDIKHLRLFDLKGRMIRKLVPVNRKINWNREDHYGKPISNTVIIAQLITGQGIQNFKFFLTK